MLGMSITFQTGPEGFDLLLCVFIKDRD